VSQVSEVRAIRAIVGGRVQGVGYRYATVEQANRLGLSGWARNLPSGQVEVLAQGPETAVDQLVAWLGHGPRWASVSGVEVGPAEPDANLTTFQVRF
jgi:acylphosphatase